MYVHAYAAHTLVVNGVHRLYRVVYYVAEQGVKVAVCHKADIAAVGYAGDSYVLAAAENALVCENEVYYVVARLYRSIVQRNDFVHLGISLFVERVGAAAGVKKVLDVVALHIYQVNLFLPHRVLPVGFGKKFGDHFQLAHHRLFKQDVVLDIEHEYAAQGIVNACNTVV